MDQNKLSVYAQSKQETCISNDKIPKNLYEKYGVNCGLCDKNEKGS